MKNLCSLTMNMLTALLRFDDRVRPANLLPIHMFDFDVILGMDWLASHRATIDYYARTVIFGTFRQPENLFIRVPHVKSVKLISMPMKARTSWTSPAKELNWIELSPVFNLSHRLRIVCPVELKELKEQEFIGVVGEWALLDPVFLPWGSAPVLFVKKMEGSIALVSRFPWSILYSAAGIIMDHQRLNLSPQMRQDLTYGDGVSALILTLHQVLVVFRYSDASRKFGCVLTATWKGYCVPNDQALCPNDQALREKVMTEAHSSPFTIHPGSTKMYRDLKQYFWWNGMKQDVATFVSKCMTCQQVKIEHQRASGLLQPLEIPMWKWDEISMDFVTGLPTTQKRHDAIWVVVDRLTKSAHFLPIRKNYGISKLAEIFRQEIVRLHGTPTSIVSDRDPKFTSRFWKGLQKAWGTRLKFSTAFHPQTDGQSERTIQTLEDMLRACALEWTGSWDEYLCLVEFAYNNSWHASIKAAPFELLYGRKCRAPICWDEVGERLIEGPELIEITNEKVAVAKEKLKEARSRQKSYADKHRRDLEFQVGDRVFLKVSPFRGVKRFGIKGKLSPRFIGPFEILERIGEVSYRLALPPQLSHVHDVFHVSLLRGYHYHPLHVASYPFDQIQPDMSLSEEPESILDRQERVMRNKVIPFVKILWKNHPEREATWETEESMRASYPHFFV
ncbi:putative nucleotidyltransferase, ribonuclease H [Tanacetum coccineum]